MTAEVQSSVQTTEKLPKKLRWWDAVAMCMTMPAALFVTLGGSIASLGGWGAALLWAISMVLALGVNWLYIELASMFPESSGGVAGFVAEAWKKRAPWLAPLSGVGYWLPWAVNPATFGLFAGLLIQAQWFPDQEWSFSMGPIPINLPIVIALVIIVALYVINVIGVRLTMSFVYITAGLLMIPLFAFIFLTVFSGDWHPAELTWGLHGWEGLHTAIVWLYIMGWTSLGVELCTTFTPEYRDPVKESSRAIRFASLLCLGIFAILPITLGGYAGEAAIAADPSTFFVSGFAGLVGGNEFASGIMLLCLIAALLLVMLTSVADSSRVLYNMGKEGVTVRAIGMLNRRGVPVRSLTVALVLNIVLLLILQNPLALVVTGNLGYVLTHVFATAGFAVLRKDRPDAARPIKLRKVFVPLSIILSAILAIIVVVGATGFSVTGYGGLRELGLALGILASGVVIWLLVRHADKLRSTAGSSSTDKTSNSSTTPL